MIDRRYLKWEISIPFTFLIVIINNREIKIFFSFQLKTLIITLKFTICSDSFGMTKFIAMRLRFAQGLNIKMISKVLVFSNAWGSEIKTKKLGNFDFYTKRNACQMNHKAQNISSCFIGKHDQHESSVTKEMSFNEFSEKMCKQLFLQQVSTQRLRVNKKDFK